MDGVGKDPDWFVWSVTGQTADCLRGKRINALQSDVVLAYKA